MCLHPNQGTLIVGDQSGTVHVWDLATDYNEQLVRVVVCHRVSSCVVVRRYPNQKWQYTVYTLILTVLTLQQ